MKIAVVDTTFSGDLVGGAQTFLIGLLDGLVERDNEVHFVTSGEPNVKLRARLKTTGSIIYTNIWKHQGLAEDQTPVFARWINELRPDAYVVSVSPDMGWTVLPHLDSQIATVAIAHSDSNGFYDPLNHYVRFISNGVGVSPEICKQFDDYCGLPLANTTWIPYGVEASSGPPDASGITTLNLVYVGRLAEADKKASDLIRIATTLTASGVDYLFRIIGDGPLMPQFRERLANEIAVGNVQMLGWLDSAELLGHLRQSEVFLLASESEGFCIALVEAMANGCCPVVTDIRSGNKQLVTDGENGFIVPVGDIDGFVDKIKVLADDRERLLKMRRAAWETGRQYSVERMVDAYEQCFERAIADVRETPRTPDPAFPLMESCRSKYPRWLRRIAAEFRS